MHPPEARDHVGAWSDRGDPVAFDRDGAAEVDVVRIVHRHDDRIGDQQPICPAWHLVSLRSTPGSTVDPAGQDGTTIRSSTCWNATLASWSTFPWSIVVNSRSR